MRRTRPGLGYVAVAAAAIAWAFGGTLARRLIDRGASALEITEARAWIATVGLGLAVYARRDRNRPRGDAPPPWLFVVFGLAIAAANFTYYSAIARLPVAVAIVVQYTAPALVVLWVALVERAPPSRRVLGALLLVLAGVALLAELPNLVATGRTQLSATGFALAAASAVAFSTYIVTGERIRANVAPEVALFRGFAVAGLFWILVQATRGAPHTLMQARFVPGVILIALVATILPFTLFVWGLGHINASRAGIVSTLEPLSAAVIAYAWLGQSLDAWQLGGGALVIAGIALVQLEHTAAAPLPAPLE